MINWNDSQTRFAVGRQLAFDFGGKIGSDFVPGRFNSKSKVSSNSSNLIDLLFLRNFNIPSMEL